MKQFGRVLVVNSQSIYKDNATGITMRSILSHIPSENVMELYRYEPNNRASDKFNIRSIQIPPQSMPFNYYLRKMLRLDNYREKNSIAITSCEIGIDYSLKDIAKIYIKAAAENSFLAPPREFLNIIDEFRPTCIYTLGGSLFIGKWVLFLSKRYSIPIVVHYMDNWRETAYTQDRRLFRLHKKIDKQLDEMESRMSYGMVISDYMGEAYTKKYHKKYLSLMNTVCVEHIPYTSSNKIRIVYAGGLHLGRDKILRDVAECVDKRKDYTLYIYTSNNDKKAYCSEFFGLNVIFKDYVPHEKINEVYKDSDVLIHIESFDPKTVEYTKYSMSTKVPEYMAAGRPIICYAPNCLAAYKYIKKNGVGISVSAPDELSLALDKLKDLPIRLQFGKQGEKTVKLYHSESKLKNVLKEVFEVDK